MKCGFNISGVPVMIANLKSLNAERRKKLENALNAVMTEMVNYIKESQVWEDRTGNLRNSISYVPAFWGRSEDVSVSSMGLVNGRKDTLSASGADEGDTLTGIIYAGMEYAIYVEYSPGRWVISGAFSQYPNQILSKIKK